MLLTIFNLPAKTRYVDVKSLIHSKCGFKEVILDNLTSESNDTKRVTVGLAEEEDAAILVRKINGLFVDGQQLYVETIKKKTASAVMDFDGNQEEQQPTLQQPYYQQNKFQPNYELSFSQMQQSRAQPMGVVSLGYGGMYGSTQNSSANFGYPQQMQYQSAQQPMMAQSMVGYDQRAPLGFSNQGKNPSVWSDQNDWNHAGNASAGNQISQQGRSGSRWENTGDSSNRPDNDEPARIFDRERPSRFGHDALSRDAGRSGPRRDFDRDAKSRDRARGAPRDLGRERDQRRDRDPGRDRDQGRDRFQGRDRDQGRDRGRDAPARDRGREAVARNAPFREPPVRNPREHGDALFNRRAQPPRAPTKRQITPPPAIYGRHVTDTSQPMRTISQQRGGFNPNQPQPKQKKADSNYVPPNKRPKKIAAQNSDKPQVNVSANKNQGQVNANKNKPADNLEEMPIRAATWRHQIASVVGKEILQNPKHKSDIPMEQLLAGLKRGIWCRLEELFGGDFEIRMPDMLNIYKEKFGSHDDTALFNHVKTLLKSGEFPAVGQKAAPATKTAAPVTKKAAPVTKKAAPTGQVESAPQAQPVDTTSTIPCYPQGDKRANKGFKKANAQIFEDETVLLSKMKSDMQKAVIDEIDEITKAIASDFEGESDVEFKGFNEKEKAPLLIEDCKKMVTVNLAKRLLNIGPIMLRIYTVPKTVSRTKLAPVLAEYGVMSLRKSERKKPSVYYGTVETYDEHDRLCLMDPLVVDGSTVKIKPFHLTGKAEKRAIRINVGRDWLAVDNNDDVMVQETEDFDDEIDEDIIDLDSDNQGNVQEDDNEPDDNENEEIGEPEQDVQDTEMGDDEDPNGNIKLQTNEEEENTDQNAQLVAESETKTEETEQIGSEPVKENGNTEVDNTKQIENTPEESKDNLNKAFDNIDFTEDVKLDKQYKTKKNNEICEEIDHKAEKGDSEVNAGDLEDIKGNIIDTIDMADLNDDDLEDW